MNLLISLHRVSEFFFLALGFLFLSAYVALQNSFLTYESQIFLQLMDLPILFFGCLFGVLSLRISLSHQYHLSSSDKAIPFTLADTLTIFFAFLLFSVLAYIELMVPNV